MEERRITTYDGSKTVVTVHQVPWYQSSLWAPVLKFLALALLAIAFVSVLVLGIMIGRYLLPIRY